MRSDDQTSPVRTLVPLSASPMPPDQLISPLRGWTGFGQQPWGLFGHPNAIPRAWTQVHREAEQAGTAQPLMPLRQLYNPMIARCTGSQLQREGWCVDV